MKLTETEVREMRRIYVEEGAGSREIDWRFGYVGSQGALRNRSWHDPAHGLPLKVKPCPNPATLEILGQHEE